MTRLEAFLGHLVQRVPVGVIDRALAAAEADATIPPELVMLVAGWRERLLDGMEPFLACTLTAHLWAVCPRCHVGHDTCAPHGCVPVHHETGTLT